MLCLAELEEFTVNCLKPNRILTGGKFPIGFVNSSIFNMRNA